MPTAFFKSSLTLEPIPIFLKTEDFILLIAVFVGL